MAVEHRVDRVQTEPLRITALHPYIRQFRSGHAAAFPRLATTAAEAHSSNSKANAAQHRSFWAEGPRQIMTKCNSPPARQRWMALVVEPLGVITGGGKSLTSVSQGGGQTEYLADWQGCGGDAESGSSQAARRRPNVGCELTMEPETMLKQDERLAAPQTRRRVSERGSER